MSGTIDYATELALNRAIIDCYGALFRLQDAYRTHQIRCPEEVDLAITICNCKDSLESIIDELKDTIYKMEPAEYDDRGMKI